VYMCPATATLAAGGFSFTVNGSTLAAGLAGMLSSPNINSGEPITKKNFQMFTSITNPFTREEMNRIAGAGNTIIEIQDGTPKVRHFLTTQPTNVLTREGKVTRQKIDISRTLKLVLDATVIGKRLLNRATIALVESVISQTLDSKKDNLVIADYEITKLEISQTEPAQLDVEVEIKPMLDLDWVYTIATFTTET
jgi:hypothetical protein